MNIIDCYTKIDSGILKIESRIHKLKVDSRIEIRTLLASYVKVGAYLNFTRV